MRCRRGGKSASRATRAQSVRESFGRRRKTSPPAASMPSRMRWPPAMHAGQLEAEPPRQRARQRASGFEHRARARRFERDQRPPGVVASRVGDVRLGDAESREVLAGQIDAALLPIDGDVLPEVDELERRADRVARAAVRRRCRPRRGAASAGRRDWRSGGNSRAERRTSRSASSSTSCRNADRRSRNERQRQTDGARSRRRAPGNGGSAGGAPASMRVERAFVTVERRQPRLGRERRLRRRSRPRCARSDRSRATAGRKRSGTSQRCDRKVFVMSDGHAKSGAVRRKRLHFIGKGAAAAGRFPGVPALDPL